MQFYAGLFGWEFVDRTPVGSPEPYHVARLHGGDVAGVGSPVAGLPTAAVWNTYVRADLDGAAFRVWEARGWDGAQRVNEPGTWNFNDLNTHDPERAKTVYAAVFGWVASTVDFGFEVSTMWQVPGYGDFLEKINSGTRERHEDPGVPAGFSDAVGWMQQLTDDSPTGSTPHWSVTSRSPTPMRSPIAPPGLVVTS